MTKFNVGDKVRYLGGDGDLGNDLTIGDIYVIDDVVGFDAIIKDDVSDDWVISEEEKNVDKFELVTEPTEEQPVEASPSVIDLLSNLALRLTKVEAGLEPKEADEVDNGTTTQSERIESVCNEVRDLLIRKNHDYGDSFSKQFAKYGVMSGLIRMDDKIRRLETLVGGEEAQVSESIEDTIADLAGYALLTLVELRKGAI